MPKGYPNILKRGQRFGWWKVAGKQYLVHSDNTSWFVVPCVCVGCKSKAYVNKANLVNGKTEACRKCWRKKKATQN